MFKNSILTSLLLGSILTNAQTNPAITSFLQNNTVLGSYYTSTSTNNKPSTMGPTDFANCQEIRYSTDYVYVKTTGIPAYPTGIFTGDGNTNVTGDQKAIYKIPLNPTKNTGTPKATTGGNIGIFINGVSLFDFRDGVAWNNTTKDICGGPGRAKCPGLPGTVQAWNRDAIPAEKLGFDCAKGHPAGTNYHHHQNPSAFKYDSKTSNSYSAICDNYNSEGLYTINKNVHSPLIGFASDGFPIYGAYAYANTDGTGGIVRMKSSYQLKTATTRLNGPDVSGTYFNGYFREDYEYVAHTNDPSYLDEHNGRVCVTPEYPNGIYCYFATVDENNTSVYPYVVGPTFYGNVTASNVGTTGISETTTVYVASSTGLENSILNDSKINVFPNPTSDFIAIQIDGLNTTTLKVELFDLQGKLIQKTSLNQGATVTYFDTSLLYAGNYMVKISGSNSSVIKKVVVTK